MFRDLPSPALRQLREAYDLFRLGKQGSRISPATIDFYDLHLGKFFGWLDRCCPGVRRFDDLEADALRRFRAELAGSPGRYGRPLQPESLHASHRSLRVFLHWAELEGYQVDPRLLRMPAPRLPGKKMSGFHIAQLRRLLAAGACPVEELALRILVGSGVRMSELYGLAIKGPDGLPDLMIDSLDRGHAELRIRWDGGAKGRKARRVPVTPSLAGAVKRYTSRQRPETDVAALLVNRHGRAFQKGGIASMMDRLRQPSASEFMHMPSGIPSRPWRHPDGVELRAPQGGHGPLRLRGPSAPYEAVVGAGPRVEARLGGVHRGRPVASSLSGHTPVRCVNLARRRTWDRSGLPVLSRCTCGARRRRRVVRRSGQ